jgi:CBS domain containing-hemolysin-like protein
VDITVVSALAAAVVTALVSLVGIALVSARERSRIRTVERLARLHRRLLPDSDAMRSVRALEDLLAAKLLAHYAFPVSSTLLVFALVSGLLAGVAFVAWRAVQGIRVPLAHLATGSGVVVFLVIALGLGAASGIQRWRERS